MSVGSWVSKRHVRSIDRSVMFNENSSGGISAIDDEAPICSGSGEGRQGQPNLERLIEQNRD